jgi:hypothetical protein
MVQAGVVHMSRSHDYLTESSISIVIQPLLRASILSMRSEHCPGSQAPKVPHLQPIQ